MSKKPTSKEIIPIARGEKIEAFLAEYEAGLIRSGYDPSSVYLLANICNMPPDTAADVLTGRLNSAEPFQEEFEAMRRRLRREEGDKCSTDG